MHYFIFPTADSWISSGSSNVTGESFRDQNFGQDEILELKKEYFNNSFDYETRVLINFAGSGFNEISKSVIDGDIPHASTGLTKYYLRLYEAEGNKELSSDYELQAFALSQSWDEGTGKFTNNPKITNGCSWENRSFSPGGNPISWSRVHSDGSDVRLHGGNIMTGSGYEASQSFSYQSPDIEMDVTSIVDNWLVQSASNNGFLLRFSSSLAHTNGIITQDSAGLTGSFGHLKFFSRNTHTIYSPKLEVRWDDHIACSGSNTGSLTPLTMSGASDNYLYMIGLRDSYKETEKVKFRVGARKRYIQKTFTNSVQTHTGSFIVEGSGSYSIVDLATGETIIPFSSYTSMSCDSTSNYFIQWMNTFEPDRAYKIIYKLKYDDNQEQIIDNNFEFKVKR